MNRLSLKRQPARRYDVTSIGEAMLRYSVASGEQFTNASSFQVHVGGAESNVCAALAQLGRRTAWVSALPDNPLGEFVLSRLNAMGIDTRSVTRVPNSRLGTYYLKPSAPPGTNLVVYDRARSAFTTLTSAHIDMDTLLDSSILHATGITPALGDASRRLLREVLSEGRDRGLLVSFDINYRHSLWEASEAHQVLSSSISEADVVFCSLRDACHIFGAEPNAVSAVHALRNHCDAELFVISLGDQGIYARLRNREINVPAIPGIVIDRPGAGDALVAGVLDGVLDGDIEAGLARGALLAAMALTLHGDMLAVSRRELNAALSEPRADILR